MSGAKQRVLADLRDELGRWEGMLAGLTEESASTSRLPNGWSVKDLVAHLTAWQQVTRARLDAARCGAEPTLPGWLEGGDPEADDVDRYNARIDRAYRALPWADVQREWRDGFREVLDLADPLPAADLEEPGRYPWLEGYPLIAVLQGTYEHHHDDHLPALLAWIDRHRDP